MKCMSRGFETLKALANSSPGLRFANPGITGPSIEGRNPERVASPVTETNHATPSGLRRIFC